MSASQLRLVRFIMAALVAAGLAWACAATAIARRMVYVANNGTDNVTPFEAAPSGALTPRPPVAVGDGPLGAAATPDGRYLYVALNDADKVAALAIAGDGSLTFGPTSPVARLQARQAEARRVLGVPAARHAHRAGAGEEERLEEDRQGAREGRQGEGQAEGGRH